MNIFLKIFGNNNKPHEPEMERLFGWYLILNLNFKNPSNFHERFSSSNF